jgi:hypothetical protein
MRSASLSNVGPTLFHGAATSVNGDYSFDGLSDGDYAIWVDSYRSRAFKVTGDTWFDIDIPHTQLAGRVLEENGRVPIVGAVVEIRSADTHPSRIRLGIQTDHFGQFALAGLEPGEFVLSVHKPGYEMHRERMAYGSPTTGMTIRLRASRGAEIRAREAKRGAPLRLLSATEVTADGNGSRLTIRLDENGIGYLSSTLAGSTISFHATGYQPVVIPDWTGQGLELRFER